MKGLFQIVMSGTFILMPAHGEPIPAEAKPAIVAPDLPILFKGEPHEGLKILGRHRVIATYDGAPFSACIGKTKVCPRCDASGEFATFVVKDYLDFHTPGEVEGDGKQGHFSVRISDFGRKPVGDEALNAVIAQLKKGDLVLLEWLHQHGEVRPGSGESRLPVLLLEKISAKDAEALLVKAKADAKEK